MNTLQWAQGRISSEISHNVHAGVGLATTMMRSASAVLPQMILGVVILTWLHIKAIKLVIRQLRAHPDSKPLWVAVANCFVFALVFSLSSNKSLAFAALVVLSFWVMVGVAKIVEVYFDKMLNAQFSRGYVVDQVLHEPW